MIEISLFGVLARAVQSLLTLYMMLILVRWAAGWLQLDLRDWRLRWIPRLTDPFVDRVRRLLPPLGPVDLSTFAALFFVWIVRAIVVLVLLGRATAGLR